MTSFGTVYELFLSMVSIKFPNLDPVEIERELFNWTVLASSYFKFPRISLDYFVVTDENQIEYPGLEVGAYFVEELTPKEISVIVEYMKLAHFEIQLSDSKKFEMYYEDANLKLPSQSALITQTNRSYENQLTRARKVESDYYRAFNNKPTIGSIWKR